MKKELLIEAPPAPETLRVTSREVLVTFARNLYENFGGKGTFIHIELPCGSVDYETEEDVPYESVPCPCGKHWFIKYE